MEMELPNLVKVLEVSQISPPFGSVSATSLPLTFFDVLYLTTPPVQRLFYYEFPHTKIHFIDTILPNLKHSLSLTLQHFFPLAGNLIWPQDSAEPKIIYMEGDAVSLTVAESGFDFDQLSSNQARDEIESYPLIPKFKSRSCRDKKVPLLALQATIFPNKGICIGMAINHVVADGRTSVHFIKSWASICFLKGDTSLVTAAPPFCERSLLEFLKPQKMLCFNEFEKNNVSKHTFHILKNDHLVPIGKVRSTFVMGLSGIKRLKQWILARLEQENKTSSAAPHSYLSSFVATSAYVWVCFVKARWGESETDVTEAIEYLIVPADARGRIRPPLPITYFGNCISGTIVKCSRRDLIGKNGIVIAAKMIGAEVQNLDIYKKLETDLSEYMSIQLDHTLGIASSPKFGVYETDFGWGKPKMVEMSSIQTGHTVSVSEWPHEEGAIEVALVRNKIEMDNFARIFTESIKALF